jgi:biopolymer transport protein ExbD
MAGEVVVRSEKSRGRRKKARRVGVRIDMTPMVDVAFLLLTFFMLTTVFSAPQTMEITLPPSDSKVEVAESNLLTIRVAQDGSIFWNLGVQPPQKIEFKSLRQLLLDQNAANPKLINLLKVDRRAKYHLMVDVMDELQLANVGRFSLAPMTDADAKELDKLL